jgi:hypothetical protein
MKNAIILILFFFSLYDPKTNLVIKFGGHNLSLNEAKSILGEPCIQMEKISTAENGGHQFKTKFVASDNEKVVLYYVFESCQDEIAAKIKFNQFKLANQNLTGYKIIPNLGSEAFYHTDQQNFSIIIARSGNEMIRLKVNKLTHKYSYKNLLDVTESVIRRI